MNNTVDPAKLKKAKIASSCFMGLGQILFLKQYLRGALYALVEVVMICCVIFGTKKVIPADNKQEQYMKGIPEYSEMIEYLEEHEYDGLSDIKTDRADDFKKFFSKKAPEAVINFQYQVAVAGLDAKINKALDEEFAVEEEDGVCTPDTSAMESDRAAKFREMKSEYLSAIKQARKASLAVLDGDASFTDSLETIKKGFYYNPDGEVDDEEVIDYSKYFIFDATNNKEYDFSDSDDIDSLVSLYEEVFENIIISEVNEEYIGDAADKFREKSEPLVKSLNDLVDEYNHKLAKIMSRIAYKDFNEKASKFFEEKDAEIEGDYLASEKEAVAQAREKELNAAYQNYLKTKEEIESRNVSDSVKGISETIVAPVIGGDREAAIAASSNVEKKYTSLDKEEDLQKCAEEYDITVRDIKAKYKYDVRLKILADNDIQNEFDSNYDNCHECWLAAKKGHRTVKHSDPFFGSPIVSAISGLLTLGEEQPTSLMNYKDHSINMMIDGIFALIFIALFVVLYLMNIQSAKVGAKKILKNGRYPTMRESQDDMSQHSFATIGMAPSVIMIAVFSVIPLLFSALVAFTNYQSPDHIPPKNLVSWVGFENFRTMFSTGAGAAGGGAFFQAFANAAIWTFVWAIFATFTCFFVGFFFAVVLQDKRIKFPSFYRTIYILPYAIPTMLSLFIWANLLNGQMGPINHTLRLLGIIDAQGDTPVMFSWLSNPWVAKFTLIFVNIWIGFPYSMILTTSSMTAISNSLYEAATIDGANKWHQFRSITFPLVMFQLKPILIMQFAGNINNFGAVFFLTGGGPNLPQTGLTTSTSCGATDLLISWIYKLTMNTPMRYNLASVLSLLVFAVLVPFALYSFTRTKSFKEGEV